VGVERGLHGEAEPRQGEPAFGALGFAAAVAAVDLLVGVQEEAVPGQVEVEIEEVEVEAGDPVEPDQDELFGDVGDLLQTNNLFVKRFRVRSGHSPEDEEDRLAGLTCLGLGGVEAVEPAGGGLLGLGGSVAGLEDHPAAACQQRTRDHRSIHKSLLSLCLLCSLW
jgi:hypothetical protein